jgi:hypothetical protein
MSFFVCADGVAVGMEPPYIKGKMEGAEKKKPQQRRGGHSGVFFFERWIHKGR